MPATHVRQPPVVLLVDPDQDSRLMYRFWLEDRCGFRVKDVAAVGDALCIATASAPDIIATEMALPGVDGYELCHRVREHAKTRATPIIAVTAGVMPAELRRAYDAGCDLVLAKPCLPETLLDAIHRLLPSSRCFPLGS